MSVMALLLLSCQDSNQLESTVAGTIHFSDGRTQPFLNLVEITHRTEWQDRRPVLRIFHNNADHRVPFDRLRSIEIVGRHWVSPNFVNATVRVTTTTGVTTEAFYGDSSFVKVVVNVMDALSGEPQRLDVNFVKTWTDARGMLNGSLNVSRITFTN